MNKKLITLAIAAAMAAPAAALAEATLYGKLHQSIDYINQDDFSFGNQLVREVGGDIVDPDPAAQGLGPVTNKVDGWSGWTVSRANGALRSIGGTTVVLTDFAGNPLYRDGAGNLTIVPPPPVPGEAFPTPVTVTVGGFRNGPVTPSNRIGVKGSEDLGNGLKAIYQVEFGINLSDGNFAAIDGETRTGNRNAIQMRNTFVGLAGNFGTFLVGRHDTPLKISTGKLDMFADTMADYNGALNFHDVRADNAIAYISPSWSGFQFAGAVHAGGGATVEGDYSIESDSLAEAWSLAAIYSNGPWYASAAYESLNSDLTSVGTIANANLNLNGFRDEFADYNKWRFGLGILDWNGFSLTGIYEDRDNTGFVRDQSSSSWQVQAGYAFGNNMIKAAYGAVDRNEDDNDDLLDVLDIDADLAQWTIAFDHNFSKRTKVYALYNNVDDNFLQDWDGFSLGLVHSF